MKTELKRPTFNDEMLLELAQYFGKELFDWQGEIGNLEECIEDCKKIFRYSVSDGYELARDFEREGYDSDEQLVDILSSVNHELSSILDKAVKKWVIDNDIKPELSIGTEVRVKYGFKSVDGIINGYRKEHAQYAVCVPSQGMTMDGGRSLLVKYENAIALTEEQDK